jgi:C1A family cysteine protease
VAANILINSTYVVVSHLAGWIRDDCDERDAEFDIHNSPLASTKVIPDCDNRKYFLEISEQIDMPSCTACSGADVLEAGLVHALVVRGTSLAEAKKIVPNLSRMFAWYWGRSFMPKLMTDNDESGCFNRLIMEVIARFGLPPENLWPYDKKILAPYKKSRSVVRPSITSQRAALKYRSNNFYNIPSKNKSSLVSGIDMALSAGCNVVWGTVVGTNFTEYQGGVINVPSDPFGGHAMVLCGKKGNAYWCRNSWSKNWGLDGYCLVSQDLVTWSGSSSFWVLVPKAVK